MPAPEPKEIHVDTVRDDKLKTRQGLKKLAMSVMSRVEVKNSYRQEDLKIKLSLIFVK